MHWHLRNDTIMWKMCEVTCNRKSCGVPVATGNLVLAFQSVSEFDETDQALNDLFNPLRTSVRTSRSQAVSWRPLDARLLAWFGTCGETPSLFSKFDEVWTRARFVNIVGIPTVAASGKTHFAVRGLAVNSLHNSVSMATTSLQAWLIMPALTDGCVSFGSMLFSPPPPQNVRSCGTWSNVRCSDVNPQR